VIILVTGLTGLVIGLVVRRRQGDAPITSPLWTYYLFAGLMLAASIFLVADGASPGYLVLAVPFDAWVIWLGHKRHRPLSN
jgi:hypothetical protein